MKLPTSLLTLLILLSSGFCIAQEEGYITGTLQAETGEPIGFASVAVMQQDLQQVTGTIADENGKFSIKSPQAGMYLLRISAVGYTDMETAPFEINISSPGKDFLVLSLTPDVTQLKEVSIEASRPEITHEADRMVVRVEGTAMAAGNNAFTVVSRLPGIFVDPNGNIQLNGRSGVTVMLDGRLTYLSAAELRNMLEGMPAENVKNIEIIANPSAKYDAEGTAGILNINLRKNMADGMNGSIYSGYTHNFTQYGYSYGGTLNLKKGRWSTLLNVDGSRRAGGREATFTRIFRSPGSTTYFDQEATGNNVSEGPPSVRAGADYKLNDNHSVGAVVNFTTNTLNGNFLTDTYIGPQPDSPNAYVEADNFNGNTYTNYTFNVHYVAKLDTLGTSFSTDLDYVKINNDGDSDFYNYFTDLETNTQTTDFLYTKSLGTFDIYSAKADFMHPFTEKHKMEAGLKASHVISDNNNRFFFNNGEMVLDPLRTNHFNFKENIFAAYFTWNTVLSEKVSVKAGLRAENTQSTGTLYNTGQVNRRDYTNLFPSLFFQQKVNDNYSINYSYSRRITRPRYDGLNPFRAYRDPYTWYEGNPFLRPQFTHAFSISQIYKKKYSLSLSVDLDEDVMSEIPILEVEDNTTIYTTGNVDRRRNFSLSGIAPLKITKWWDTQNTALLWYSKLETDNGNGPLVNEQLSYYLRTNQTFWLPAETRFEMNILYQGPAINGLYRMGALSRVDLAVRKSFFDKKLDLTLSANDIFKGYRYLWKTDINGNINDFDQYMRIANVAVNIRYNFSKGQEVKNRLRNDVEEVNRT